MQKLSETNFHKNLIDSEISDEAYDYYMCLKDWARSCIKELDKKINELVNEPNARSAMLGYSDIKYWIKNNILEEEE